jgi:hypothetical protein
MIYLSIFAALLLFLVLAATIVRSLHSTSDLSMPGMSGSDTLTSDEQADEALQFEALLRIFSEDDHRFVAALGDPRIQGLLHFERKRMAIGWIRRKTAEARSVMREHARRVRELEDLKVSGEARLAFQYFELLALCELLALLIFFFGPAGLQGLAVQTNGILLGMRRLGETTVSDADLLVS